MTAPAEFANVQRILVRATNWVGDAVMSLPALEALRVRFPRAEISCFPSLGSVSSIGIIRR